MNSDPLDFTACFDIMVRGASAGGEGTDATVAPTNGWRSDLIG